MTTSPRGTADDSVLLQAALELAGQNIPVFPVWPIRDGRCACGDSECKSRNWAKHPLGRLVPHGLNDASTDPHTIRGWWRAWPDANLAIPTGRPSGCWVLDVDPRDDPAKDGRHSLHALEEEHGPLPPTLRARTGNGGGHVFFRHDGSMHIQSRASDLAPGLDSRGDGGYVLVEPSATSGPYTYLHGQHLLDAALADAPDWLLERVRKQPPPPPRARTANPSSAPPAEGHPYVRKALEDEFIAVASAGEGQRNDQLNRSAFNIGQLVECGGLLEQEVIDLFEDAATRSGLVDDDGLSSVLRTIRSGLEAGQANPRTIPPATIRFGGAPTNGHVGAHQGDNGAPPVPGDAPIGTDQQPPIRPWSDLWNAEQYATRFGERLRHCGESGWYHYRDGAWREDRTGYAMRSAKRMVRDMLREAAHSDDEHVAKGLGSWASKCHAASKLESTLRLAQTEPGLAITITDFDRDPLLLNVANGTIDLRTGKLRPHRAEDLLTKQCPLEFNPAAACERWTQFLAEVFDDDQQLITYIQRLLGFSLTGLQTYHQLVFLWGAGRNGKTTLLEVSSKILGDYARSVSSELLLQSRDNSDYNVAQLRGARLVITSETGQRRRLDEARVKLLTGGDTLPARHPYGRPFTFVPTHHVWLMSNNKPAIEDMSNGIWSRVKLIEFPNRFELPPDGPEVESWQPGPHVRQADPDLPAKLEGEYAGILRWFVDGAIAVFKDGLHEPASVTRATLQYREQMDVLGSFLTDCCDVGPYLSDSSKRLYSAYRTWCQECGIDPVAANKFGMLLTDRGDFRSIKPSAGEDRNHRRWSGLQVKPSAADDDR